MKSEHEDLSDIRSSDLSNKSYDINSDSAFAPSGGHDVNKYVDPNDLVYLSEPNSRVTFGYIDGKLIYHTGVYRDVYPFATHSDLWLSKEARNIIGKLRSSGRIPLQKTTRELFHLFGLFGRIGILKRNKNVQKVSFWNREQSAYNKHLGDCMNKLEGAKLLTQKTIIITTPLWSKEWDRETDTAIAMDTKRDAKKDAEAKRRAKMQERMHLATGAEKKKIMKDLKLGFTAKGEHPWAKTMSQKGLLVPGAKWWAPQSESFSARLDLVLIEGKAELAYKTPPPSNIKSFDNISPQIETGKPIQLRGYHATTADFDAFNISNMTRTSTKNLTARGVFFYGDKFDAERLYLPSGKRRIIEADISFNNPFVFKRFEELYDYTGVSHKDLYKATKVTAALRRMGHDGYIKRYLTKPGVDEVVTFDINNINIK